MQSGSLHRVPSDPLRLLSWLQKELRTKYKSPCINTHNLLSDMLLTLFLRAIWFSEQGPL